MDKFSTTSQSLIFTNATEYDGYNEFEQDIDLVEHEFEHYHNIYVFISQYFISLAFLLEALLVACGTSFISFLIYKFKRLRTRTNYIFLNLMISSTILILSITTAFIISTFGVYFVRYTTFLYHFISIACFVSLNSTVLFVLFLAIDWLISANYSHVLSKYQQKYKFVIIGIYLFAFRDCLLFLVVSGRFSPFVGFEILFNVVVFILSAITVTVFYIIKKRKNYSVEQSKTEYALIISCTFFLMCAPVSATFLGTMFMAFFEHGPISYKTSVILTLITCVLCVFALASPLVFVALLPKLDKNFAASYQYVFKKAIRNYIQQDGDEDLIEDV